MTRLIHDTGHNRNNFIQRVIQDRNGYGLEVTRLLRRFLDYSIYKRFSYKLKLCKGCARELNRVSGD